MKKQLFTTLLLTALSGSLHAAPPTMAAGADGNSVAFKNGASEAVVINSDGTVEGTNPTANNHFATKEYVDTQTASASGGTFICGLTSTRYSGNLGGVSGANSKCVAEFGAGWTFGHWSFDNNMMHNFSSTEKEALWAKRGTISSGANNNVNANCRLWSRDSFSDYGRDMEGNYRSCEDEKALFCCKQ